jgi:hypothetical protein
MFVVWAILALIIGAAGVYVFRMAMPTYREVVHRIEKVPFNFVASTALLFGISGSLLYFAAFFFGISAMEAKTVWSSTEIIEIASSSIAPGFVVLLASLYQMYSTRKFRQWMMKRK